MAAPASGQPHYNLAGVGPEQRAMYSRQNTVESDAASQCFDEPGSSSRQWGGMGPAAASQPVGSGSGPGPGAAAASWAEYVGSSAALEEPPLAPRSNHGHGGHGSYAHGSHDQRGHSGCGHGGLSHGIQLLRGNGSVSVTDLVAAWGEAGQASSAAAVAYMPELGLTPCGAGAGGGVMWPIPQMMPQDRVHMDYSAASGGDWRGLHGSAYSSLEQVEMALTSRVGSPLAFASGALGPGLGAHSRSLAAVHGAPAGAGAAQCGGGGFVGAAALAAEQGGRAFVRGQAELVAILEEISELARRQQRGEESQQQRLAEELRATRSEYQSVQEFATRLQGEHRELQRSEAELKDNLEKAESRSSMYEGSISTLIPQLRFAQAAAQAAQLGAAAGAAAALGPPREQRRSALSSARGSLPGTARGLQPGAGSESTTRRLFNSPNSDESYASLQQADDSLISSGQMGMPLEAVSQLGPIAELRRQLEREAERGKEQREMAEQLQMEYEQAFQEKDAELRRTRIQLERVEESFRELSAEAPMAAVAAGAEAAAAAAEAENERLRSELEYSSEASASMAQHFQSALDEATVQLQEKDLQLQQRASELLRRHSQVTERSSATPCAAMFESLRELSEQMEQSEVLEQPPVHAPTGFDCMRDLSEQMENTEFFDEQSPTLPTLPWGVQTPTLMGSDALVGPEPGAGLGVQAGQQELRGAFLGLGASDFLHCAAEGESPWEQQVPPVASSPGGGASFGSGGGGHGSHPGSARGRRPSAASTWLVDVEDLAAGHSVASSPAPRQLGLPATPARDSAVSWLAEGLHVQDVVQLLNGATAGRQSLSQGLGRSRTMSSCASDFSAPDLQAGA